MLPPAIRASASPASRSSDSIQRRATRTSEPTTLTVDDLVLDLLSRRVTRGRKVLDLRPREFALLEYLMRNVGRVSEEVSRGVDRVGGTLENLRRASETMRTTTDVIRTGLTPHLVTVVGLVAGLKTGTWTLLRRLLKKRRSEG